MISEPRTAILSPYFCSMDNSKKLVYLIKNCLERITGVSCFPFWSLIKILRFFFPFSSFLHTVLIFEGGKRGILNFERMLKLKNQSNFKSTNAKQIVCPMQIFGKMHLHIGSSPIFSVLLPKHPSHCTIILGERKCVLNFKAHTG